MRAQVPDAEAAEVEEVRAVAVLPSPTGSSRSRRGSSGSVSGRISTSTAQPRSTGPRRPM